jgi:large subunit ribosomal protein L19
MGAQDILDAVVKDQLKTDIPHFDIGDTLNVHVRIVEGEKERIQVFSGTLLGCKGSGINKTFKVRRIVDGQGVERVFMLHSPRIAKIEVVRRADARRAKLYFLRERTGKRRRLRDRRRALERVKGLPTIQK